MMITRRLALLSAALSACGLARAQAYPSRPIVIITNSAPGGQSDGVSRLISASLKDRFGQPINVDNKPGANSTIAANAAAKAAPDGYTLNLNGIGSFLPVFSRNNSIDIAKVMTPVGGVYSVAFYIYVRSSLGVNSLQDLIAYSQKNDLKMGVSNASSELALAVLKSKLPKDANLNFRVIPYKSDVAIVTALLGNEVDFCFSSAGAFLPHLKGNIKAILSSAPRRVPAFPDVPTGVELGLAGFVITNDQGIWVPNGTPAEVIQKWQAELTTLTRSQAFIDKMAFAGNQAYSVGAEQQLEDYNKLHRFWQDAARLTGYQPQ